MKLYLSKAEKDFLRKINRLSYYLPTNENIDNGYMTQEENLSELLKNIQGFLNIMYKKRGIVLEDRLEEVTKKTIKFLNDNTFLK